MKNKKLEGTKPIVALYDANAKKLIGVFSTSTLVAKYIFKDEHDMNKTSRTSTAWAQKNKVNHHGMSYAIRTANEEQKLILGTNEYIILNGYKEPTIANMSSFDANRVYLNSVSNEKLKIYRQELKKKIKYKLKTKNMKNELDMKKFTKAVLILKSINHKLRQDIVKMIDSKKDITVTEIYKKLQIEQSIVSQHLSKLRLAKVLTTKKEGRFVRYYVNHDRISQIKSIVDQLLK
jgi:DNA-binding transcriptional ArsR family regulator